MKMRPNSPRLCSGQLQLLSSSTQLKSTTVTGKRVHQFVDNLDSRNIIYCFGRLQFTFSFLRVLLPRSLKLFQVDMRMCMIEKRILYVVVQRNRHWESGEN